MKKLIIPLTFALNILFPVQMKPTSNDVEKYARIAVLSTLGILSSAKSIEVLDHYFYKVQDMYGDKNQDKKPQENIISFTYFVLSKFFSDPIRRNYALSAAGTVNGILSILLGAFSFYKENKNLQYIAAISSLTFLIINYLNYSKIKEEKNKIAV